MSLRVAEEVERYRAFVEHLRTIRATGLRGAVSLEAMSSYTGKNGMLSRDITFFTDEAFEVFSLLYDFEVRRELMRTKAVNFFFDLVLVPGTNVLGFKLGMGTAARAFELSPDGIFASNVDERLGVYVQRHVASSAFVSSMG